MVTVDWMHSKLQNGSLTVEAFLLLDALEVDYVWLESYLATGWDFPASSRKKSSELHRVFNDFRSRSSQKAAKLKCSAAELLGLYGLLRHFVETKVSRDTCAEEQASFFACCDVMDIIQQARHNEVSTLDAAPMLRRAVSRWLRKHKVAYGSSHVIPKFCWMWDIVAQFFRDPFVIDMFVVERGHLAVKSVAERCHLQRTYERSVLSGTLAERINQMGVWSVKDSLQGKVHECSEFPATEFSARCIVSGNVLAVGDVVFDDLGAMGRIVACAQEQSKLVLLVESGDLLRHISPHSSLYELSGEVSAWCPLSVRTALAWYNHDDKEQRLVVLVG